MKKNSKAFIEKIKTIGINTGAKAPGGAATVPNCPGCGGKMVQVKLAALAVIPIRRQTKPKANTGEQAFSA